MFLEPSDTIDALGIPTGAVVADFGSGTGGYTLAAARSLAGSGRVYGVDVQKDLLARLKKDAHDHNIANVEVVWGDCEKIGGTTLRDQSIDLVIVANVLYLAPDRVTILKEAKRVLRPGGHGRLLVVDWTGSFRGIGPTHDRVIGELEARQLAESVGFIYEKHIPGGSHHYALVFHT